jgi:type I restriction enzyme S subunit
MVDEQLSTLMVKRASLNPAKYPDEKFELYSIPAYDAGKPEVVKGLAIGSSKKCVEENDVLLSRIVPHIRRAWVVGKYDTFRKIGSGEWIIFKNKNVDSYYLRYFFLSDIFHPQLMQTVSGVGGSLLRARPEQIKKIKIPLPPLDTQKRIVALLEQAQALIDKRKEQLALMDELASSLFYEMFGDPVRNPMVWEVKSLEEIGKIQTGNTPPSKLQNMFNGNIPFITPGDLYGTWIKASRTVTEAGALKSKIVAKGSTLVCCIGATIGKMGKASELSAFNQQINAITWGEEIIDDFGLEMMKLFKTEIAKSGASTTLPILKKSLFSKIIVPVPPIDLQNEYSICIRKIEQQKVVMAASLKHLEDHFKALMQRAFKGEI